MTRPGHSWVSGKSGFAAQPSLTPRVDGHDDIGQGGPVLSARPYRRTLPAGGILTVRSGAIVSPFIDVQRASESLVGEYDAIREVVQTCLDGEAKGDAGKLKEVFHQDARMFGDLAGTRYDVPIQTLFDMAAEGPADTGNYQSRTLSITHLGDVATATAAEEGYWGTVSFVDFFSLSVESTAHGRL